MEHKGNRCETEDGAATRRITWPWQRCAGSGCFLVSSVFYERRNRRVPKLCSA